MKEVIEFFTKVNYDSLTVYQQEMIGMMVLTWLMIMFITIFK